MAASSPTTVYAGTKRPLTIDDQDEDVRIAVRALGDMRSMVAHARAPSAEAFAAAARAHSRASSASQPTPLLTHSSASASTTNSSPVSSHTSLAPEARPGEDISPSDLDVSNEDFVSRVTHLPLVNTALKAYEHSKERSRVVKYGANLMENSVKTLSRPVIDRLPVGQLDDFACRQLDRFGYSKPITPEDHPADAMSPTIDHGYREPPPPLSSTPSRAPSLAPSSADEHSTYSSPKPPRKDMSDAPGPLHEGGKERNDKQAAGRSKWQAVLLEAGGIGAAVSEESMKRLQYCLQWLQYATTHIDSQILILRSFIDSLTPQPPHKHDSQALVPLQTMRSLTDVRRDVVNTIRQVVDVISRYAGGALPEPARATVRSFILRLPTRWASVNPDVASQNAAQTPSNQTHPRADTESSKPVLQRVRPTAGRGTQPTAGAAAQAAQRVLALAMESLDMIRSVTAVFKESLDRAEAWVERLRVVGIQRQGALPPSSSPPRPPLPGTSPNNSDAGPSASSRRVLRNSDNNFKPPPPSPTSSLSSSMPSLTNLSLATLPTTSLPTSIASGTEERRWIENVDDGERDTETEDEDVRWRDPDRSAGRKYRSRRKGKESMRQGMEIDG